jgi:hypothetical protein
MKKHKLLVFGAVIGVIILVLFPIYKQTIGAKIIGTVSGTEYEQITIDHKTYTIDFNNSFSNSYKGHFLGLIRSGDVTFRIYSVKGDKEGKYIYRLSDYEGAFYRLKE